MVAELSGCLCERVPASSGFALVGLSFAGWAGLLWPARTPPISMPMAERTLLVRTDKGASGSGGPISQGCGSF